MSASSIFTRNTFGLDRRVWLTCIIAAVLSIGLLGFKIGTNVQCYTVMLTVQGGEAGRANTYYAGQPVAFTADMAKAKKVVWDFGDNTKGETGATVRHAFEKEGSYTVTVTVNGGCSESVTVFIVPPKPVNAGQTTAPTSDNIFGPDAPAAGEPVRYTAAGMGQSYDWTIVNSPEFPVQNGPSVTYTFMTPGTRIIQLKLDNDPAKIYTKTITVLPSTKVPDMPKAEAPMPSVMTPTPAVPTPTESANEGPKVLIVPDEEFKSILDQVTENKKDLQALTPYLCNGGSTKVQENDESGMITLGEFIGKVKGKKKFNIKTVKSVRDEKNCVILLKVYYKKKGFLGL